MPSKNHYPLTLDTFKIQELDITIEKGHVLKLANKMQDKYEPIYTKDICIYPIYPDYQDFNQVNLLFSDQVGENARRLFSLSESTIQKIELYEGNGLCIIQTELFEVRLPHALKEGEVMCLGNVTLNRFYFETEEKLINSLDEIENTYLSDSMSVGEREDQKIQMYEQYYIEMLNKGKWDRYKQT